MTGPLIECVPNFSEGRHPEVVEAILASIRRIPGAALLDWSSDPDHNRAVVTLAGSPEAVVQAAFSAVACAASPDRPAGAPGRARPHRRRGRCAVYPARGRDVWRIASRWPGGSAARIGGELELPVYLYGQAADAPRANGSLRNPQRPIRGVGCGDRQRSGPRAGFRPGADRAGGRHGGRSARPADCLQCFSRKPPT